MSEWKTIDSAPKDGSDFLAWVNFPYHKDNGGYCDFCCWSIDHWQQPDADVCGEMKPTHWMPLPTPPGVNDE